MKIVNTFEQNIAKNKDVGKLQKSIFIIGRSIMGQKTENTKPRSLHLPIKDMPITAISDHETSK